MGACECDKVFTWCKRRKELVEVVKECFSERIVGQTVEIAVPRERVQQWEEVEVPEIIVVSDAVEGTFVDLDGEGVDVPGPQIAAKIPDVVETIHQEHVSDDLPVPQVVKEDLEVIKVPQKREFVRHVPEVPVELVKLVPNRPSSCAGIG